MYVGVGSKVVSACMQHSGHLLTSQTTAVGLCRRVLSYIVSQTHLKAAKGTHTLRTCIKSEHVV